MTALAVLTGSLPKLGVVVIALLAAAAMLAPDRRLQAGAVLGALALAPVLLLAEIGRSPQLSTVHRQPLPAAAAAAVSVAVLLALAVLLVRRPALIGPLAVLALPFRIPVQAGGVTSNLLVPLYVVVAAGSLALVWGARSSTGAAAERLPPSESRSCAGGVPWIERALGAYVVLYALQSLYSPGFETALRQLVFFYVPFALLFCLLRRLPWTPLLVRRCLQLVIALAVVFAGLGFVEYATKTLILNPRLIAANDVHAYFTVNSVFFDPDVFGRFLALVMIPLAALLLYGEHRREQLGACAIIAVLWGGLVLTLSRSSLGALLVGLGTLAALRWRTWRALLAAALVLAAGAAAVAVSPKTFGLNQGANGASSGRASLVSGGIGLFADRPALGYGSGSFVDEYRAHHPGSSQTLSASHTIPITIAAEQGVIGELAYLALVLVAAVVLIRDAGADPARATIAAIFLALVFHTLLYADFLEDPVTWTLLGVGGALTAGGRRAPRPEVVMAGEAAVVPA